MKTKQKISLLRVSSVMLVLLILLGLCSVLSLAVGSAGYSIQEILKALFSQEDSPVKTIVLNLRLPRIILAILIGSSLSAAGALLQSVMRNPLADPGTIGVSAGALNGLNYVAGNIGRAARTNLRFRHDDRYVGLTALRHNHGLIGFDFAFHELNRYEPLNLERLRDPRRRFVAVATDCRTGKPLYFEKGKCEDIFKAMQASASMPYFSQMVVVEGRECLDGGCSRCIPYEWALEQGYEKIVVVRTREEAYRATHTPTRVARKLYRDYPNLVDNLRESDIEYNRECDELAKLKEAGRIFMICPSEPPAVGRIEKDMEKLGELYYLGYNDAMRCMDALKAYLGTARR